MIPQLIALASTKNKGEIFLEGQCHTLALSAADNHQGKLVACLHCCFDEEGQLFSEGYSHVMYQDACGKLWDIGGDNTDLRWYDHLGIIDEADDDGLVHDLRFEERLTEGVTDWLMAHHSVIDEQLLRSLTILFEEHKAAALDASCSDSNLVL